MNLHHQIILEEIKKYSGKPSKHKNINNYIGTASFEYNVPNLAKQQIAKNWAKQNKNIFLNNFLEILDSLNAGQSHEEKSIVGRLLFLFPKLRFKIKPQNLSKWLDNVHGWAEVDGLCQNNFQYQDFLGNWFVWEKALQDFSKDKNVHKKRASLVLLTGPVNYCPDIRLSSLAFKNIDRLKSEKDILITKAISWLLRSLIKFHRPDVEKYLEKNKTLLPKIAVRETSNKLKSGRKSGK